MLRVTQQGFDVAPYTQMLDVKSVLYPSSCRIDLFLAVMCKHDVIRKPEVHNVSQCHETRTEPRTAMGNMLFSKKFRQIGTKLS